jgi:peptide/nickel transport system substrate-binding protein
MISQYVPSTILVYQRNPYYWGGANGVQPTPRLNEVIMKVVPDALTRLEDLESGSAQIAYIDLSLANQVRAQNTLYVPNFGSYPFLQTIAFNTQRFPFNITLIREAVAHAINETALLQEFYGYGVSMVGPVPLGVLGYNYNLQPYSYNLTLAKQLLAEAGYPNGQGLPTVTLSVQNDRPPQTDWAPIVQSNLADIGIKVSIQTTTSNAIFDVLGVTPPQNSAYPNMIGLSWFYFPDPWCYSDLLIGPTSYGWGNIAYYNSTQVNTLLAKADATVDQTQRGQIYQDISRIAYNDVPYIYVAQFHNSFPGGIIVSSTSVAGFAPNFQFYPLDLSTLYVVSPSAS